jgi:exosortase
MLLRLLVVVLVGLVYVPTFKWMARDWYWNTYAAHGVFVPLFAAHFLWVDRARLRAAIGRGDGRGLLLLAAGLGALALGAWHRNLFVQGLSFVVTLAGAVLWLFGLPCLRQAAFALGFLAFMVPLPRWIVGTVTLHLQVFAATFAGAALSLFEVPFYRHGVQIELPNITLEVAEICNGLRFLTALVVLTVAFAQVGLRSVGRKLVLISSAVPIAILANAVRVATVVVGTHYVGPEVAVGFIHHTIGKVVWVLTLIPLLTVAWLLRRSEKKAEVSTGTTAPPLPDGAPAAPAATPARGQEVISLP